MARLVGVRAAAVLLPASAARAQIAYSNWELSSARALEVVGFMIEKGMPAENVGAAGYAEFDPVADNSTPEGRAQNRRIEIMMMPTIPQNLQDMLTK
jgi:chemotaxis protein MotB